MQQSYLSESELFASRSLQLLEVIKAESGIFFICLYMYIYIELVSADSLNLESFDQASFAHAQSIFAAERMRQWKSLQTKSASRLQLSRPSTLPPSTKLSEFISCRSLLILLLLLML